jgi:predicted nucleic acid-binding protein
VIVLDTNVVSEAMSPRPHAGVLAWIAGQPRSELFTTSVTKAEILYGIAILPPGRRKLGFAEMAERIFNVSFAERVLAFHAGAAAHYAEVTMMRRRAGRPITPLDAQIAAIALCTGAAVATRDVAGFQGCGLEVLDPWTAV